MRIQSNLFYFVPCPTKTKFCTALEKNLLGPGQDIKLYLWCTTR